MMCTLYLYVFVYGISMYVYVFVISNYHVKFDGKMMNYRQENVNKIMCDS